MGLLIIAPAYASFRLWVSRLYSPKSAHSLDYPTAVINSSLAFSTKARYALAYASLICPRLVLWSISAFAILAFILANTTLAAKAPMPARVARVFVPFAPFK